MFTKTKSFNIDINFLYKTLLLQNKSYRTKYRVKNALLQLTTAIVLIKIMPSNLFFVVILGLMLSLFFTLAIRPLVNDQGELIEDLLTEDSIDGLISKIKKASDKEKEILISADFEDFFGFLNSLKVLKEKKNKRIKSLLPHYQQLIFTLKNIDKNKKFNNLKENKEYLLISIKKQKDLLNNMEKELVELDKEIFKEEVLNQFKNENEVSEKITKTMLTE